MAVIPSTTAEWIWFGTRAVRFESGGSTGPQIELLSDNAQFATRTLNGLTNDVTGSEWQQFLAFSGTEAELAALGINLTDGVDTATTGQVNTTGDLRVGSGVVAQNLADIAGNGRLVDTSGTLEEADDALTITGLGKANLRSIDAASFDAADTGNRVVFSNDLGFGLINSMGAETPTNAARLNDGDSVNFALNGGKQFQQASFVVKVLGGGSTNVVIDSDGATIQVDNVGGTNVLVQDASLGELDLGAIADGTKVTINYQNSTIWISGIGQFLGDTTGFFAQWALNGKNDLTLGSVVGNNVGWSADSLALLTDLPPPAPTVSSLPETFTGTGDPSDSLVGGTSDGFTTGPDIRTLTDGDNNAFADSGNDTVYAQGGADSIRGFPGTDLIYGQAGADTITGHTQNDTIYGGSGNDLLSGGVFPDGTLTPNSDVIIGGYGADTLYGHGPNDTTSGGDDIFKYLDAKDTNDLIMDWENDKLDFSDLYAGTLTFNAAQSELIAAAHSVSWFQDGTNTQVIVDLDGNPVTAELAVTLAGLHTLTAANFIL